MGRLVDIVFAVAYVIGGTHATRHSGGRVWVDVVEILLGVALVVAGVGRWQRRNTPDPLRELRRRSPLA